MATRSGGSRSGRSSGSRSGAKRGAGSGRTGSARRSTAATRSDKGVEAFRDALEKSVTLSRDRLQEVVDDAVRRGRMTRDDANELVSNLVTRGRELHRRPGEGARAPARPGATRAQVASAPDAPPRHPGRRSGRASGARRRRHAAGPGRSPAPASGGIRRGADHGLRPADGEPDQVTAWRPEPRRAAPAARPGEAWQGAQGRARGDRPPAQVDQAAPSARCSSASAITARSSSPPTVSASSSAASSRWPWRHSERSHSPASGESNQR